LTNCGVVEITDIVHSFRETKQIIAQLSLAISECFETKNLDWKLQGISNPR